MFINPNFKTITEGKVNKFDVIPPNEIYSYVKKNILLSRKEFATEKK